MKGGIIHLKRAFLPISQQLVNLGFHVLLAAVPGPLVDPCPIKVKPLGELTDFLGRPVRT